MRKALVAALFFLIAGAFFIRPITVGYHDSPVYLGLMRGYLEKGLAFESFREPLYPLFLASLVKMGLNPVIHIAIAQNLIFLAALYFLCRTILGSSLSRTATLLLSASIALIPTFWIVLNGAIYAESIAASLVFTLIAATTRFYRALEASSPEKPVFWALLAALCSVLLGFNKGSFIYANLAFPLFAALFFAKKIFNRKTAVFLASLLAFGIANKIAISLWFGMRPGEPLLSKKVYTRGGALLYGRVAYAEKFDFIRETPIYLLNALSESACRHFYGERCENYGWNAEGLLGWELHDGLDRKQPVSDERLMSEAIRKALHSPFRQAAFCFYELSRFALHHTTNGFAWLKIPVLGRIYESRIFILFLKIFNAALFLVPFLFYRSRLRDVFSNDGTKLYVAYALSVLAVHGFIPTLVRMCYPIAPLLVLLNWQAWAARREGAKL